MEKRESTRRDFVKRPAPPRFSWERFRASSAPALRRRDGRADAFFNFSHLGNRQTTHFLYVTGRKYRLTKVEDRPDVLAFERRRNEFLRSVPDDQITHHVQGVLLPLDIITLGYSTCDENSKDGTWAMTAMSFQIRLAAMTHAYTKARERTPLGSLPLSGKRKRYKLRAALTEQDLREEQSLVDPNSHAEALVGLHPDILSVEPNSGAHIQANYVTQDSNTQFLAAQLQSMGPATPGGANNMGLTPWATLMPLINEKTGMPFKKSDGVLNQYYPDWDPSIDQLTAPGVADINPLVKNDESLGVDITGYNLNDPNNPVPQGKLNGKLWGRHDGIPTVDQSVLKAGPGPTVALKEVNTEIGLRVWDPTHTTLQDGRVRSLSTTPPTGTCAGWGVGAVPDPNDAVIP